MHREEPGEPLPVKLIRSYTAQRSAPSEASDRLLRAIATSLRRRE